MDKSETKKGSVGVLVFIIILLVLVVAGLLLYYEGNIKGFSKNYKATTSEETVKEEDKGTKLDLNSPIVAQLLAKTDEKSLINYKGNYVISKLTELDKFSIVAHNINVSQTQDESTVNFSATESEVKRAYEEAFGINTYSKIESFDYMLNDCMNVTLKYDSNTDNYIGSRTVGGSCFFISEYKQRVISAVKYSDQIEIQTKVYYVVPTPNPAGTVVTYDMFTKKDGTEVGKISDISSNTSDTKVQSLIYDFVEKNSSKFTTATYVFKLASDGGYYYTSANLK